VQGWWGFSPTLLTINVYTQVESYFFRRQQNGQHMKSFLSRMVMLICKLPHNCSQITKGGELVLNDSANAGDTLAVQGKGVEANIYLIFGLCLI